MPDQIKLDSIDERILGILQQDATLTVQQIGDRVGLSATPCWRRIKLLEAAGVIDRRVAILDAAAVGLKAVVLVFVRTNRHEPGWLEAFAAAIEDMPEIVECHRLTGHIDYMLKCIVRDIDHYDEVYKRLIARAPGLADVSAAFSMERLKQVTRIDVTTAR
ncbi:MAG TPA: Lrp/AsnC family transcriptional regulator [Caulobacteraceae bacterium]|jgi:Lrp/AsnC family transcriptional regulator